MIIAGPQEWDPDREGERQREKLLSYLSGWIFEKSDCHIHSYICIAVSGQPKILQLYSSNPNSNNNRIVTIMVLSEPEVTDPTKPDTMNLIKDKVYYKENNTNTPHPVTYPNHHQQATMVAPRIPPGCVDPTIHGRNQIVQFSSPRRWKDEYLKYFITCLILII